MSTLIVVLVRFGHPGLLAFSAISYYIIEPKREQGILGRWNHRDSSMWRCCQWICLIAIDLGTLETQVQRLKIYECKSQPLLAFTYPESNFPILAFFSGKPPEVSTCARWERSDCQALIWIFSSLLTPRTIRPLRASNSGCVISIRNWDYGLFNFI